LTGTLYTLGYTDWSFYDFFDKVRNLNCIIVDVRFSPKGYNKFWEKENLSSAFQDRYMHEPKLGNKNYREPEKEIEISDLEMGAKTIIKLIKGGTNCLLLCSCSDYNVCHRKVVSEYMVKQTECQLVNL
jgi:uncharacterized protein (DUF488 family)